MVSEADIEVVISGIGGSFPEKKNVEELKHALMEQVEMINTARWKEGHHDVCDKSGNIDHIAYFDASYFGVHQQQAYFMDPMHRIALEKAFEALIDAGVSPLDARGKRIGVYMGSTVSENDSLMFENVESGFGVTGQARCMLSNRISYWLNVTGPSCSIDSTWLGGLEVIKQGYDAIMTGECDAALVGVSNLTMNVCQTHLMKLAGFTSSDGQTKTFDDTAEGYGRSDGIVVLYLQRADLAKRHYASIVHVDTVYNGYRNGPFMKLDADGMSNFIEQFYQKAKVDPTDVQYVEAYGCGIKSVDALELRALDKIYNKKRHGPLPVGTIKTHTGHSEPASTIFSIINVILSMENDVIFANKNYQTPNKNIPSLMNGRFEIVTENKPFEMKLAAVNGVGLSSSYGHILLKSNTEKKPQIQCDIPMLRLLSTRNEEGINEIVDLEKSITTVDLEYATLVNDIFSNSIPGHLYRGYVSSGTEVKHDVAHFEGVTRQVWFVYSGMGSQWTSMGKDLMKLPIFAAAIHKCHNILLQKGLDLLNIITTEDKTIFDDILHSFVGIAAIQIGLTDVLRAIGIMPDGIIGHSVGELGCAYADGCLTAEQMILSAYYRGKASKEVTLEPGMMAAIGVGAQQIKKVCPPLIDVACHNGPDSCTLSGPKEAMEKFVAELQAKEIFAKLVNVSNIAYHSRYIKPAAPLLLNYLKKMIPQPVARSSKWISTSVIESKWDTDLAKTVSAEYLTNNLLSSVYFEEGCKHIPQNSIVIEIAPHGLLQAILRRSLHPNCINVPLTKRATPEGLEFLFAALGRLYISGLNMNISNLYPPVNFPVSRGTKSLSPLVRWSHDIVWRTGIDEFLNYSNTEQSFEINLTCEEFKDLAGHALDHQIIIPVVFYLPLVSKLISSIKRFDQVVFEDITVKRHRIISEKGYIPPIRIMVQRGSGNFEINDRYGVVASGRIVTPENFEKEIMEIPPIDSADDYFKFKSNDFYSEFQDRRYQFSGPFRTVEEVNLFDEGITSKIEWKQNWATFVCSMIQLHMLHAGEDKQSLLIPNFIRRIAINLEQLPTSEQVLDVNYHFATKVIQSTSVQIHDVQCQTLPVVQKPLLADKTTFMKYSFNNVPDIQTGLDICVRIVQKSLKTGGCQITEIKDNNVELLTPYIKKISERSAGSKIYINTIEDIKENIPTSSLVILSDCYLSEINTLLSKTAQYVLLYLLKSEQFTVQYPTMSVFAFEAGKYQYHLLKRACNEVPKIITVKSKLSNPNYIKDSSSLKWFSQLRTALADIKHVDQRIYLVTNALPTTGIENLLSEIKTLKNAHCVRLLIILDTTAPECSPTEPFYESIFKKDLPVSVLKNGVWGYYFPTPFSMLREENIYKKAIITGNSFSKMVPNYKIKYIGINVHNYIPNYEMDKHNLGPVEFAGEDRSGKRVMGIAKAELNDMQVTPDPELVWPLPENWSYIDGATVPYAYAIAYYVLMELVNIQPGESVLIHNGCSSFGQAAINVAYKHSCIVYTTVASEKQKVSLMEQMKMFGAHQILDYTDSTFDYKLMMATHGLGVNVIVNSLAESQLQASMRCLQKLGRIVQIEVSEQDKQNSIGLSLFLTCVGMHGVFPRNIFNWSRDMKRKIHSYVMKGIASGSVKPLNRIVKEQGTVDNILRYLKGPSGTGTVILPVLKPENDAAVPKKLENFITPKCTKIGSYLIYGTDTDMLINTVESLILHGARKIIICSEIKNNRNYIHRRLGLLQHYHEANIKLISSNEECSGPSASIYHEIQLYGPISTVLILPHNDLVENVKLVEKVDEVLRSVAPKAHMICFWGSNSNVNYKRDHSLFVSNIGWDRKSEFNDVIKILDKILVNPDDVYVKNNAEDDTTEENFTYKDFFLLLARSYESLSSVADSVSKTVDLIQLASNTSNIIRDSAPVFIVPGLMGHTCKYLKEFVRKLMSPAYVVNLNDSANTIRDDALVIVEKIKQIYDGPYNIVGVSWGGALATEIAKILENQNERIQLYLIDGIPETIQSLVTEDGHNDNLEATLLLELLQGAERGLATNLSWKESIYAVAQSLNYSKRESHKLEQTMDFVKNKLQRIIQYKPSDKLVSGVTRLLRPQESSKDYSYNILKYCKQVKIEIIKGNHFTMLQSDALAEYVNMNAIRREFYH